MNYKQISQSVLKGLPQRTIDIIESRFGLKDGERQTLEAIGQQYGITRERVRQIEEEGLMCALKKLSNYPDVAKSFSQVLKEKGGIKKEEELLLAIGGEKYKNHARFLLTLSNDFKKAQEDDNFYSYWTNSKEAEDLAKKAISFVLNNFKKEKAVLTQEELYKSKKEEIAKHLGREVSNSFFASAVELSKNIFRNSENKLGLKNWLEINPKGVKDKAYLVLRKEGKPLHFTQVASYIDASFANMLKKKTHKATVHNELIKDSRFVLVGRGMYGLKEWGYEPGLVKDVVVKVLKEAGKPLSKQEVIERVLKQRIVKPNTVFLNLQDKEKFSKDEKGNYMVKEA